MTINELQKVNSDPNYIQYASEIKKWLEKINFNDLINNNIQTEVFYQGSYSRHTNSQIDNIDDKSDIDIVLNIFNMYSIDKKLYINYDYLTDNGNKIFNQLFQYPIHSSNLYNINDIKEKIFNKLIKQKPNNLSIFKKTNCIKITNGKYTVDLAVIFSINDDEDENKNPGILLIWTNNCVKLTFPKQNIIFTKEKHSKCGYFYQYVRILKNLNKLLKKSNIKIKLSSYILECFLYNIDNKYFTTSPNWKNVILIIELIYKLCSLKQINEINQMLFFVPNIYINDITQLYFFVINLKKD